MQLTQDWQELETTLAKIITQTWIDEQFHQKFVSKPADVLREAGAAIEDFVKVIVKQNDHNIPILQIGDGGAVYEINLPPKPENLREDELNFPMKVMIDKARYLRACC